MSIVYQYENTTIQYGDELGNISHQGILASNVTGTPLLTSTFPTTSTGDSLGHYHYTEPGTNALKFLNVSGTGSGGHKFYTANDTTAPVNTCSVGLDGLTIDRTDIVGSTQVLNLQDGLTINTGSNNVTLNTTFLRSTNNKTSLELQTPSNGLYVFNTVGNVRSSTLSETIEIQDFANNLRTGMTYERLFTFNQNLNTNTNLYPGLLQQGNSTNVSNLSITELQINDRAGVDTSTLNRSSLNITNSTNSNTSILTATNLTFNNINVKMNQVQPTLIYSSAVIYADGQPPATSLSIRNTYGYSGWYFKNILSLNKINWYFPAKTPTTTPVSALKGISISFFNGANTSNDNTLFITVLTVPTGINDFAPGFFHSSNTYVFNQSIQPTANTNYQGVCILDIDDVPYNYETQIQYEPSTVNNPRGTYAQTDNILAVVIGSNSSSPVNSVEFVVNKLNLHYVDFTQSYLLVPP